MSQIRIVTIVINWKLKEETVGCVHSLERLDFPSDIIVVDNNSNDGSVEYITRHCPSIELLELPSNIGFGPACNHAIAKALRDQAYDYLFLFNNDATIHPQALAELISAAENNPQAGILGAKVYYSDKPNTIWYAGARRRQGVLAATDIGRGQVDQGQFSTLREVDYIFGAAMLIRRTVFEQIGLFDEQFFLYLEDLDLCLRAQEAGFSLLFVPEAHVWHKGSASTEHNTPLRRYQMARSTILFLRKHTSLARSLPVLAFWVLVYLRDIISDLIRGDYLIIKACWSGLLAGLAEGRKA